MTVRIDCPAGTADSPVVAFAIEELRRFLSPTAGWDARHVPI